MYNTNSEFFTINNRHRIDAFFDNNDVVFSSSHVRNPTMFSIGSLSFQYLYQQHH